MAVEKVSSVKIEQEKLHYTIHLNYVLQNVKSPVALSVWCYLSSLPPDWDVYKNQLQDHFDLSREELGKALKFLNENGLIEYVQERTEKGTFVIWKIIVKNGYDYEKYNNKKLSTGEASTLRKIHTVDSPQSGKLTPIKEIINKNINKKIKKDFFEEPQKPNPSRKPPPYNKNHTGYVERDTTTEEYRNATRASPAAICQFMNSLPKYLRPKKYRPPEITEICSEINQLVEKVDNPCLM
jgi:hypothetical protein